MNISEPGEESQTKVPLKIDPALDYVTKDGIRFKIGVDVKEAPLVILKEKLDNSVSAAEKAANPRVTIYITSSELVVGNNGERFPLERIWEIYDPHYRATSKIIPMFEKGFIGHFLKVEAGIQSMNDVYVLLVTKNGAYKIRYERAEDGVKPVIEKVEAKMFDENNVTEFHLPLPLTAEDSNKLKRYAISYMCCNPHVTFVINGREFRNVCEKRPPSRSSVRWLSGGFEEFKDIMYVYLQNLPSALVADFIKEFSDGSINGEIVRKPLRCLSEEEVKQLYDMLLEVEEPKAALFTDSNYVERLNQVTYLEGHGYAAKTERDKDGNFEYALEVLAAKVSSTEFFYPGGEQDGVLVICSINSSPLFTNIWYGTKNTYYVYPGKGKPDLYEYVRNKSGGRCNLLIVNLWIPKPPWTTYSKDGINSGRFLNTFKKLLKSALLALKGKSRRANARIELENEILRRIFLKLKYSIIPTSEWTTQNGLWYKIRKKLGGEDKMGMDRKSFLNAIKEICEAKGFSRDELGITCAPRGEFYYRGEVYPLSLENIEKLARLGTDIVHIEKEGVPRALKDVAKDYPIAFTHSRGFLVEYGKKIIELSKRYGANVVMITDLDDAGLVMKYQLPDIPRIGIDEGTLRYFNLEEKDVREEYRPGDHLKYLQKLKEEDAERVSRYRIEIDSILAEVGPDRFLEFIIHKLCELYPERNYNRAINVATVFPEEINELTKAVERYLQNVTRKDADEIRRRLERFYGLERVDKIEEEVKKEILQRELEDDGFRAILEEIRKLIAKVNGMTAQGEVGGLPPRWRRHVPPLPSI